MFTIRFRYLILVLLLAAGGSTGAAKEYPFQDEKVFTVGENPRVEINYPRGKIDISSHELARVVIRVTRRVNAVGIDEARAIAERMVLKVDSGQSSLTINTAFLEKTDRKASFVNRLIGTAGDTAQGEIDFTILVPERCDIAVSNSSGAIAVSNLRGAVDLRSSAGEINLNTIEGPVTINNASGNTTGDLIYGPITIHQPMGKIELNWVEGDVRINSTSASISVQQERGSVDLVSATGTVHVQTNLFSSRDNFISTESGDVSLLVPQSGSASLDIGSELGNVTTDIPITIRSISGRRLAGEFGEGGVGIHVTSSTGDVSIAQY